MPAITFVVAVNDHDVLTDNLLASPCLRSGDYEVILQEGFSSAARAYNDAIRRASGTLLVFAHQDVFFPDHWITQLENSVRYLDDIRTRWGVLGCWGTGSKGHFAGHIYSNGWGILGSRFEHPVPVRILDEIVLITRRDSSLVFDESLPHFHFYGTDICLRAASQGLPCYAIPAFCIHNTNQLLRLPREFYTCYKHIKRAWRDSLPIATPCITISRFDVPLHKRKCEEAFLALFRPQSPAVRISNPSGLFVELRQLHSW